MIALRAQEYFVPELPNNQHIISPQVICTSEGYKVTFIAHCHDEHGSYEELNLKEDKPGCQKAEPVDKFNTKYDPKNNLPIHESILPNQRQKESTLDCYILGSNMCNG